ncbi:MAG: AbrB/MazE/SpoVT family DNA-binding domain-containing protein [Chloroflexota bacterium]|nr:AbrB/MazE/SpoVT family DNA-binding domain-containing protein [Chloroflexota bacterium]
MDERAKAPKLIRVQEKGQVTLPADVRRRMGLKKGDMVAVIETEDGVLISPQKVVALKALDRIGEVLRAQGASLDELMDSGREIRGEIVKEKYDLDPHAGPTTYGLY